ncbi:MAG: response regulator [Verrucomicrobiales bacterium]|nr:response regulator [Verrucomicrobiales bacterium]
MSSAGSAKPIDILLVEDSPTDALITQEALSYSKILNRLHIVTDGVDAIHFLRRQGPHQEAPRPDLILLDLNLPKKTGAEVLKEIKGDPILGSIPVVVLSTSQAEEDINRSYGLHASCYITKPVDFAKFAEVVQSIRHFWFSVVTLPVDRR